MSSLVLYMLCLLCFVRPYLLLVLLFLVMSFSSTCHLCPILACPLTLPCPTLFILTCPVFLSVLLSLSYPVLSYSAQPALTSLPCIAIHPRDTRFSWGEA